MAFHRISVSFQQGTFGTRTTKLEGRLTFMSQSARSPIIVQPELPGAGYSSHSLLTHQTVGPTDCRRRHS